MLPFERRVVTTLARDVDPARRPEVIAYVDAALRSMPEYLRAGVAAESVALGAWSALRHRDNNDGGDEDTALLAWLERLEASPLDPIRQYVRLLSSLVLFAREELAPEAVV
jgi:hypothetical protein